MFFRWVCWTWKIKRRQEKKWKEIVLLWNEKDDSNGDGDGGKVNNGDKSILKSHLHFCVAIILQYVLHGPVTNYLDFQISNFQVSVNLDIQYACPIFFYIYYEIAKKSQKIIQDMGLKISKL